MTGMHLTVGADLDGSPYPGPDQGAGAALGAAVVGFQGLLTLVATRVGLREPEIPLAVRIAQYERRLRAADTGTRFYSASLATDAWNTARTLLQWRDELVAAGWRANGREAGARLLDLAAVEQGATPFSGGWGDRLRAVLNETRRLPLDIAMVDVVDDVEDWPPCWRSLLDWLEALGVTVRVAQPEVPVGAFGALTTDLAQLAAVLETGGSAPVRGDGSVVYITAAHTLDAADAVADFLPHWSRDGTTVIIRGAGSTWLDGELARRGLPRLGVQARSPQRGALQVLPLALSLRLAPFSPGRLLELLSLNDSPVPRRARGRMARAVAEHPGRGGPLWQRALAETREAYEALWEAEGVSPSDRARRRTRLDKRLRFWLGHDTWEPSEGLPVTEAQAVAAEVARWAGTPRAGEPDPVRAAAARQALDSIDALGALGVDRVSPEELQSLLAEVLGPGLADSDAGAEAGPWRVVDRPGQLWGPADTVVWWDFCHDKERPPRAPWTDAERAELTALGAALEPVGQARRREAAGWRRVVRRSRRRLVLIAPRQGPGGPLTRHPFWDEIRHALGGAGDAEAKLAWDAGTLYGGPTPTVGGAAATRTLRPAEAEPSARRAWRVSPHLIGPRPLESPTSIERLLGCSLAWAFEYPMGIRPSRLLTVPDEGLMLGNLSHRIMAELFQPGMASPANDPDALARRAESLWDAYVPEMAAPLLEPGRRLSRGRGRARMAAAVRALTHILWEQKLRPAGTEVDRQRTLADGVELKGRLDLLLAAPAGRPVVVDLKWSSRRQAYREMLAAGRSVQLAAYQWLVDDARAGAAAYYLLPLAALVSVADPAFPPEAQVQGPGLSETWSAIVREYAATMEALGEGRLLATGIDPPPDDAPRIPAPCTFCVYTNLCGRRGTSA